MTSPTPTRSATLELSRDEAWVLHAALAAQINRELDAGEVPRYARSLILLVEAGETAFDHRALLFIADALAQHLEDAPESDERLATTLLVRVRNTL